MSIVQLSGIGVTGLRNKLGDNVYTRNRGGQTVRSWVIPANTASTHRTNARNNFATAVSLWPLVTPDEVIQWNIFAARFTKRNALAQAYKPTGRNMFIECNCNLLAAACMPISVPVFNAMPAIVSGGSVSDLNSGTVDITVRLVGSPVLVPDDNVLCVSASPSVSAGINYPKNFFQPIRLLSAGNGLDPVGLSSEYVANYGSPVPGLKVFFKVWCVHALSGVSSKPVIFAGLVV